MQELEQGTPEVQEIQNAIEPEVVDVADIIAEYDLQDKVQEQIRDVQKGADEIRAAYVEVLNTYLDGMLKQANSILENSESSEKDKASATNVLMNVELITSPL